MMRECCSRVDAPPGATICCNRWWRNHINVFWGNPCLISSNRTAAQERAAHAAACHTVDADGPLIPQCVVTMPTPQRSRPRATIVVDEARAFSSSSKRTRSSRLRPVWPISSSTGAWPCRHSAPNHLGPCVCLVAVAELNRTLSSRMPSAGCVPPPVLLPGTGRGGSNHLVI
jgi:hypothetical protein